MKAETAEHKQRPLRIDFHIHPGICTFIQPWVSDWYDLNLPMKFDEFIEKYKDPGYFEEFLIQEGVDYACVLVEQSYITTGVTTNEQVRDYCRGRSRLIPFCDVNPGLYARPGEELRRLVEKDGFRGLKLYPTYQHFYLNESRIYPIYQAAQDLGIPVLIHTGSSVFRGARLKYGDPLYLDDVAVDFPDLNLIMAHSGRGFWYDRAFFLSKLHANVYMEISGLPPTRLLEYFPELHRNADKVIFGSDWPGMFYIKRNMEAIAALPLEPEAVEKILGGNAAKILKLEEYR
jgi:predicted TIM-barrel fold metal-dependent hydrolase